MATSTLIPSGDFRTSYAADTTIFPTATSRNFAIAGIVLACFAPMLLSNYLLSIAIQIGGIGGLAPERRGDLARFGLRAVLGGSLATFMTATIAGVLSRFG